MTSKPHGAAVENRVALADEVRATSTAMRVVVHESLEDFWHDAGTLYEADPGRHSVPLTIVFGRAAYESGAKPVLVTVHETHGTVAAYMRTPPFPAQVSAVPTECAPVVVDALGDVDPDVESVFGPEPEAYAFSDAWHASRGGAATVRMRQRRYELDELERRRVSGDSRRARDEDGALLADWLAEYGGETGDPLFRDGASVDAVRSYVAGGREPVLWLDGAEPVAMAFVSRPLSGMSRISHVYTPLRHRQNGYGSAVTAAAAETARNNGAGLVMLYTDLANPVSNSIYQRIGFRPVSDLVHLNLRGDSVAGG